MGRISLEQGYPGIAFRPRTRNWWARLTRVPPECVHLDGDTRARDWMALLVPDTVYLRGKSATRRWPARPDVSLCRDCLLAVLRSELGGYAGRVVAFEPDAEMLSQYFFVSSEEFAPAGVEPGVAAAINRRLQDSAARDGNCQECSAPPTWLWLSRADVSDLDDTASIAGAAGRQLCARHGAQALCACFENITEANLFFVNSPYGEAGAYFWI